MNSSSLFLSITAITIIGQGCALGGDIPYQPGKAIPPEPPRELRGAWVASVANIDWPSQSGLSSQAQRAELRAILDEASLLHLNAVIFQIRPCADALYPSPYEPWSEYLTGRMGRPPDPFYDPLEFAVEQAHRRGLELHAWLNPFRAGHPSRKSPIDSAHISQTHPEWTKRYGPYLWLDPGEEGVQEHSLRVILDVVHRYDVDGVHIDDYFYPYRLYDRNKAPIDFPDHASWDRYRESGGKLSRGDWRRDNVNRFVQRLYREVKALKPWVKVGISPFGIWRPGHPPRVKGLDAYDELYADARKWFRYGWLDYLAPQLYWTIDSPGQSYPLLLEWWSEQNEKNRHLWPGIATSRIGEERSRSEILRQIELTRGMESSGGNIHWSVKPLMENRQGISLELKRNHYQERALVPASPWLDSRAPAKPLLQVRDDRDTGGWVISWESQGVEPPHQWVLQVEEKRNWDTRILGGHVKEQWMSPQGAPEKIVLRAVDRCGNLSEPAVLIKKGS